MATLTIDMSDRMKQYVDSKVGTGAFKDGNAVVQALINLAILAETKSQIDQKMLEAIDQVERGECTPWQPGEGQRILEEMIRQRNSNGTP